MTTADRTDDGITRGMWWILVAMTAAASMILVDQTAVPLAVPEAVRDLGGTLDVSSWLLTANVLPLAAFTVLGGRLGDIYGLRQVFLIGALGFAVSTSAAGFAIDMPMMLAARVAQGCFAALMLPTTLAIVSATFPAPRRGFALGILAGGSAFFAALGPFLGGVLTTLDWRLVFLINVPLALVAAAIVYRRPALDQIVRRGLRVDYAGALLLGSALATAIYGLSQVQDDGWVATSVFVPLLVSIAAAILFVVVELRVTDPLIELRLLRHANFLASNISQVLAGMVELGLGYLLPYFLLLVVGVDPLVAGIALIPATIPIVIAGPIGGRLYDRIGGRWPLVGGFVVLAASGLALGLAAGEASAWALVPGLVLQGIGLGIVLTVNDPTGLSSVPEEHQGVAAGMINTSEQLGGALGIAILTGIELSTYKSDVLASLAAKGVVPTAAQNAQGKEFIMDAERLGLHRAVAEDKDNPIVRIALDDLVSAHITGFQLAFYTTAVLGLLGALTCFLLVRRTERVLGLPVRSRRYRWIVWGNAHDAGGPSVP